MQTTQRDQADRIGASTVRDIESREASASVPAEDPARSGEHDLSVDLSHIDPTVAGAAWVGVTRHWLDHQGDGFYRGRHLVIDLRTAEGRAQLLVLANLLAAPTSESTAESTFLALADAGLLRHERLIAGSDEDRAKALEILRTTYRALADKVQKVDAIYYNQALLAKVWSGDLNEIYEECFYDDFQVIEELQKFAHLQRRAHWLAREMYVSGMWPGLGMHATAYYDVHIRRVLTRLGLARLSAKESWTASREECLAIIETWFYGDYVPLYLHGSRLCIHDDRAICEGACPVKENCSFWRQGAEQSSGEDVN